MSNYSDSSFDETNQNNAWYKALQLIPHSSLVLDVGCSSGHFGNELVERKGCTVDGIELDPDDAKLARKILRKVWVLNVETDSLTDIGIDKYDIIYFGDVIEHLVHPIESLARIKPLLKKNGQVIFSIPNMAHVSVRLALIGGDFDYTETGLLDKTHLHFYNQKEVVRIFSAAGYKIKELDFVKKDYPKKLLQKMANVRGLTPQEGFYKAMQQTDASAFQFIGAADIAQQPTEKISMAQFGPIDMFEVFYNDTVSNYEIQVKNLQTQLDLTKKQLGYRSRHPYRVALGQARRSVGKLLKRPPQSSS